MMSKAMFDASLPLDRKRIAACIPHSGAMCLLDAVLSWDSQSIRCLATSHRAAHNPLRAQGRLAVVCGIEYAAQAMAMHGALCAELSVELKARPRAGFLTSVRDIRPYVARLDNVPGALVIEAVRIGGMGGIGGDDNDVLYRFALSSDALNSEQCLLTGRAAVILDAARMMNHR